MSGLRLHYEEAELLNHRVIVVANLETSKIKDVESQGMVLCADKKGKFGLLYVPDSVALGTLVLPQGFASAPSPCLKIKEFKKVAMKTSNGCVGYKNAVLHAGATKVLADRVGNSECSVR